MAKVRVEDGDLVVSFNMQDLFFKDGNYDPSNILRNLTATELVDHLWDTHINEQVCLQCGSHSAQMFFLSEGEGGPTSKNTMLTFCSVECLYDHLTAVKLSKLPDHVENIEKLDDREIWTFEEGTSIEDILKAMPIRRDKPILINVGGNTIPIVEPN